MKPMTSEPAIGLVVNAPKLEHVYEHFLQNPLGTPGIKLSPPRKAKEDVKMNNVRFFFLYKSK